MDGLWTQAEWDRARNGVSITSRASRIGHSVREQRRCDESLIQHIFAALDGKTFVVFDATHCFMTQCMLDGKTGRRICPDAVRRFAAQPIASLLPNARARQDLKQRGVHTIGDLLPHAYEWLSPKRLAPGKPVMNVSSAYQSGVVYKFSVWRLSFPRSDSGQSIAPAVRPPKRMS